MSESPWDASHALHRPYGPLNAESWPWPRGFVAALHEEKQEEEEEEGDPATR